MQGCGYLFIGIALNVFMFFQLPTLLADQLKGLSLEEQSKRDALVVTRSIIVEIQGVTVEFLCAVYTVFRVVVLLDSGC